MRRTNPRGFTLIELLLVMVILAVLAGISVPIYIGYTRDAKIKATKTTISNVKSALHAFEVRYDRFPTTEEGLIALVTPPPTIPSFDHPLLEALPLDGWGRPFRYLSPGLTHPEAFDIISFGPDFQEGTEDDITQDSL